MGGGDDPGIGADRRAPADGEVFSLLEHAQQPGLGFQRHVADLVQEQGSARGLFETPGMACGGAREGALLVAEQFAFDQLARHRGHVDGDVGTVAPLAVVVQGLGHELLAGAGLAIDRDRQVGPHEPRQHAVDLLHGRRAADERQLLLLVARRFRGGAIRRGRAQRPRDDGDELAQVEGLGQIFEGAPLGRPDRGEQGVLGAHHDDLQVGAQVADARNQVEPVLVGHDHVGDDQIARPGLDPLPQRGRVRGAAHQVPLAPQGPGQHRADGPVVVGHQDGPAAHLPAASSFAAGSIRWNRVRPGWLSNSMTPP